MSWIGRFPASSEAEPAAARRETAIHGASFGAHNAIRGSSEDAAAPSEILGGEIAEEIKRRQILLALRYVLAVRAR